MPNRTEAHAKATPTSHREATATAPVLDSTQNCRTSSLTEVFVQRQRPYRPFPWRIPGY